MARLLIGVSGGIAAYKALELARLAIKSGHAVRVIQTPAAERFVGSGDVRGDHRRAGAAQRVRARPGARRISRRPGCPSARRSATWRWSSSADLYVIAPASANTLAKLAHGLADNLVHTAALAAACPVVVAPAMNDRMYRHPATRRTSSTLRARGVTVIPPGEGELASHGEHGVGRLAEPARAARRVRGAVVRADDTARTGPWPGLRVLVTAGRDSRADRQRPVHRQPLLGPDGRGARRSAPRPAGPR